MRLRYTREPCLCGHCGPCKSSFTQSGFLGRSCRRNVNGAKSMQQLFALEEILSDFHVSFKGILFCYCKVVLSGSIWQYICRFYFGTEW